MTPVQALDASGRLSQIGGDALNLGRLLRAGVLRHGRGLLESSFAEPAEHEPGGPGQ